MTSHKPRQPQVELLPPEGGDHSAPAEGRFGDLWNVVQAGVRAVPAVKYAVGVAAILAALGLVLTSYGSLRSTFYAAVAMLVLMVFLFIFAIFTSLPAKALRVVMFFVIWAGLVLVLTIVILTTSSLFFGKPRPFSALVDELSRLGSPGSQANSQASPAGFVKHGVREGACAGLVWQLGDAVESVHETTLSVASTEGGKPWFGRNLGDGQPLVLVEDLTKPALLLRPFVLQGPPQPPVVCIEASTADPSDLAAAEARHLNYLPFAVFSLKMAESRSFAAPDGEGELEVRLVAVQRVADETSTQDGGTPWTGDGNGPAVATTTGSVPLGAGSHKAAHASRSDHPGARIFLAASHGA